MVLLSSILVVGLDFTEYTHAQGQPPLSAKVLFQEPIYFKFISKSW
jgi:hypothetical protein